MAIATDLPPTHPLAASNRALPAQDAIEALCAAVVDRLGQRLPPRVRVEHFPNKPAEFDFEGSDAAALVIYDGSRFAEAGPIGEQGVRETVRLAVVLLVRGLRGHEGAYALTRAVRSALHGQTLAGARALRPIEIELESEDEGVFRWRLAFETGLPAVPAHAAQEAPLINRALTERR